MFILNIFFSNNMYFICRKNKFWKLFFLEKTSFEKLNIQGELTYYTVGNDSSILITIILSPSQNIVPISLFSW